MAARSFTVHEAKTNLSRLLEAVEKGQEVVITRGKVPVARLVRFAQPKVERRFGAMKGRAKVSEDFFQPLPEEEIAAWE